MDSGLGRTLSSCGRPRGHGLRSRSLERPNTTQMHYNGFGTAVSARSEPLMEPSTDIHSSHHLRYERVIIIVFRPYRPLFSIKFIFVLKKILGS